MGCIKKLCFPNIMKQFSNSMTRCRAAPRESAQPDPASGPKVLFGVAMGLLGQELHKFPAPRVTILPA